MAAIVSSLPAGFHVGAFVRAKLVAPGDAPGALAFALGQGSRYAIAAEGLKGAVAAMDTSTQNAAIELAPAIAYDYQGMQAPTSALAKLVGYRRVPSNVRLISPTGGLTGRWRAEGTPASVGKLQFQSNTLPPRAVSSLSIFSRELARSSHPGVELTLAVDIRRANDAAIDRALFDQEEGTDARPQSILFDAPLQFTSGGSSASAIDADLRRMVRAMADSGVDTAMAVWVASPSTAAALATVRSNGAVAYPGVSLRGGTLLGAPLVTTLGIASADSPQADMLALVAVDQLDVADDGLVRLDSSEQAALQPDDDPQEGPQALVSLWQDHLVALVGERRINWRLRNAYAVAVLEALNL